MKLSRDERVQGYKTVKLLGFSNHDFNLDSLLRVVSSVCSPTSIIFSTTDVSQITASFEPYKELKQLRFEANCGFYENLFLPLIKNTGVTEICLQRDYPEFISDSLKLVPDLKRVFVSNSAKFAVVNKKEVLQLVAEGNLHLVEVMYCDKLYMEEKPQNAQVPETNTRTFASPYSFIRQPIAGININDTVFKMNTSSGGTFVYESGSIVTINRNAFEYADGKPFKGKAELFYREFRNPVEILLSGIPMGYEDGDSLHLFKSGGMYEMYARDVQGNELRTKESAPVKINFAVADSSDNYRFYALKADGKWQDKTATSASGTSFASSNMDITKAVQHYFKYIKKKRFTKVPDTTCFESRFYSNKYIGAYRNDNLGQKGSSFYYPAGFMKENIKTKALFKIKVKGLTKDKKITFVIVPAKKSLNIGLLPKHLSPLFGRIYVYQGSLSKAEFKKKYCTGINYLDAKVEEWAADLKFDLKTMSGHEQLPATTVILKDDKTYLVPKKGNHLLARRANIIYKREAKLFNKRARFSAGDNNNLNGTGYITQKELLRNAFEYCKTFQNKKEAAMNQAEWKQYANALFYAANGAEKPNEVSSALLLSGMGTYNIDQYIHSGQMQPILVKYLEADNDSLSNQYNAMIYSSINTTYPVFVSGYSKNMLKGYYFKEQPNYLVRFSQNGYMQVTKPQDVEAMKKSGGAIKPAYKNQYFVKGLTSDEITRLIFE